MNLEDIAARGARILKENGIENAPREARLLLQAAFPRLYTDYEEAMAGEMEQAFFQLIERRCHREPMSHLMGYRDFYKHRFYVSDAVLDPRPDTEALVIAALESPFQRVLDLGTGSGCILLSLLAARAEATGVGTDLSQAALAVAQKNCAKLELETRANFRCSDWYADVAGQFDLIVSNPPYIARAEMEGLQAELSFEPRMALTDEADGLTAYRAITSGAQAHLSPGGRLMVEIGWQQGADVRALFEAEGFADVVIHPDLDGRDRVVSGNSPA